MFRPLTRLFVLPCLVACSPALNWRDVREEALTLSAQFPCKPERFQAEQLGMLRCEAAGASFVLSWRGLGKPEATRDELAVLAGTLAARLHARSEPISGLSLPTGAVAWPGSGRYALVGGEQPVWLQVWAQGTVLIQVQVLGGTEAVARQFFDSLRRTP